VALVVAELTDVLAIGPSAPGGRAAGLGAGRGVVCVVELQAVEPLPLVLACPSGLLRWPALACGDQAASAGAVVCTAGAELATVVVVEVWHLAVGARRPSCRPWCWPWRGVRGRAAGRRRQAAERRAVEPLPLVLACLSGLLRWPALACGDQAASAGAVVCTAGAELATVVVVEVWHLAVGARRPSCRPWCWPWRGVRGRAAGRRRQAAELPAGRYCLQLVLALVVKRLSTAQAPCSWGQHWGQLLIFRPSYHR